MAGKKEDCSTDACHVDGKKKDTSKLVKSTDLPLNGNPYPPKDVIQTNEIGSLERSIATARTALQPYLSPLGQAYEKVSDVAAIGVAHSQSTFQNLIENQNAFTNGAFIAGSSLFGLLLARNKGFIKKFLYTTTFFTASAAFCNQEAAKRYFDIGLVMAKNNIPAMASSQYQKVAGQFASQAPSDVSQKAGQTESKKSG